MYTLADLERLTLEMTVSHRLDVIAVLMGPERAAELEEMAARRPPGELIPDTEVPLSQVARQAAERSVARDTDDEHTLRTLAASTRFETVLQELAGNPATPPEVLVELTRSTGVFIRMAAAANGSLPDEELGVIGVMGEAGTRLGALAHPRVPRWLIDQAATDPHPWVRARAARNPNLSAPLLLALANGPDSEVRTSVVSNIRLPHEVLHRLATSDPDAWVRAYAAGNPAIPEVTLLALAGDEVPWVRAAAAKSQNLTPLVADLLVSDPHEHVQKALAANRACPPEVLKTLARRERGWKVRYEVAANPATPPEVRHRLAVKDRSRDVRHRASV